MPEIATLADPQGRLRIQYSRPAIEQIRRRAIDGLMALPRIGMGIGGLLLGVRRDGVVSLVNSIEIPCSHAGGPSFNLTDAEKKHVIALIAGAPASGVVGLYLSKTRGAPTLDEFDAALFREFCPDAHQIALVIRPSTVVPVRAAFYLRDQAGRVVPEIECDLDEWKPAEGEMDEAESVTPFNGEPPVVPEARIPEPTPPPPPPPPEIVRPAPVVTMPVRNAPPVAPNRSQSVWIFAAAICLLLAAAAFLTRNFWHPAPPLTLSSTESNGKLMIRWNADAFRGIDRASLAINDGGNLQSLSLDRFQLNQGAYVYDKKSQRVTAKLSAGDKSAIVVWFAPEPKEPAPAAPAATPSPLQAPKRVVRTSVPDDR